MSHLFSFLLLAGFLTGIDEKPEFLVSLLSNAEKYNRSFPSEHVYIATDRTYYRPGDELWFKAYARNTLSDQELSNDLNIKLVDVFGKQVLYLRYPLYDNVSNGYFVLPALLDEGKYHLIGYTGWMKNMPVSEAFIKEIIVSNHITRALDVTVNFSQELYYPGNRADGKISVCLADGSALKRAKYTFVCRSLKRNIFSGWGETDETGSDHFVCEIPDDIDADFLWIEFKVRYKRNLETYIMPFPIAKRTVKLEFFPEGGNIIAGLENKIAFRAFDDHGMPVDIEGYLLDGTGRQRRKFKSTFKGMGTFTLVTEPGNYRIHLTTPLITDHYFNLPCIMPEGLRLRYSGLKNGEMLFSLTGSDPAKTEKVYVIVEQSGEILWSESISIMNEELVKVPDERFKTGIAGFSVLNEEGKLVAARNVFIDKGSAGKKPDISTSKNYYASRERVVLELSNYDNEELKSNISVINKKYVHDSEIPIQNYLWFFTELKEISMELLNCELSDNDIDLILLTHETKSLPIAELICNEAKDPVSYYNNDGIRGLIMDKKGNPVENAKVKIIHSLDLRSYQASSDAQGMFHITFDNNIINYNYLTIAVAAENGRSGSILRFFDYYSDNILGNMIANREHWKYNQALDLMKYGNPLLLYSGRFGQGKIHMKKETSRKGYDYERFASYTSVLDIIKEIKDHQIVNGEIFFKGRGTRPDNARGAIIVLDGIAIGSDIDILNRISPKEIRNIMISVWPSDIQKYTDLGNSGVIEISTISGRQGGSETYTRKFQQDLLMIDHQLNSPDYALGDNPPYDNRVTLFWMPDVTIEESGNNTVTFYTSDITGTYRCILQGKDQRGHFFSRDIDITVR
ncbi:MAG: hypothetical protein JW723_11015 [Bacteroidales bacterium]|nr:hypothetical protein [Bacteroidales bacterium]